MKDVIFLAGFVTVVPAGTLMAVMSPRIREIVFFLLVFSTATMHKLDINFMSRELYRGSTRGFEFSYLDFLAIILLLSCLIAPPPGKQKSAWPPSFGFLLAFVAYCIFSTLISEPKIFPLFELLKVLRGVLVFLAVAMYVSKQRDIHVLVLALCAIAIYVGAVAFTERYLWRINRVPGPFTHSNEFSQYCCIIAPVLATAAASDLSKYVRWVCAGCAAALGVCVMMTITRMGVVTYFVVMFGVVVACSGLEFTPRKMGIGLLILVAAGAGLYRASDSLMSRFSKTSLQSEYLDEEQQGRGLYLRIAYRVVSEHFLGLGLNNWSYVVTEEYYPKMGLPSVSYGGTDVDIGQYSRNELQHMIAVPAHSLGALTLGELGVPGFIIFYVLWGRWFQMSGSFLLKRSPRLVSRFGMGVFFALSASFIHCLTEYGFRHGHIFFLIHILAGALASTYVMRDSGSDHTDLLRAYIARRRMRPKRVYGV